MRKRFSYRYIFFLMLLCLLPLRVAGVTFTGYVKDAASEEFLPYASVSVKDCPTGVETDLKGYFVLKLDSTVLRTHHFLVFSYLGYADKVVDLRKCGHRINVSMTSQSTDLAQVTIVAPKKKKYKRKGNPAVDLMRRVIAHRDSNDIRKEDFYSVNRYEKILLGLNNFSVPTDSLKKEKSSFSYLYPFVDSSEVSDKTYLPFSIRENLSKISYSASPQRTKQVITAKNNKVLMNVLSEQMIDNVLRESFAQVNLYDNNISLYISEFVSPLSTIAPTFYHFFISDTVVTDSGQKLIEMSFVPANTTDLGFTGTMLITTDSSYAVTAIRLDIPRDIKLNVVESLHIEQEYAPTFDGRYALSHERMITEVFLVEGLQGGYVKRDAYYTGYQFHDIDKTPFDREANVYTTETAAVSADTFWQAKRPVALTKKEAGIDSMANQLNQHVWFKLTQYAVRTAIEGYMTLGHKGYFDYGPVMSTYSSNYLEGARFRVGGRTNPALNRHLFFDGYLAYGCDDEKLKHKAEVEYSFPKKDLSKMEFPRHSVLVNSYYDWEIPSERFLGEYNSSFVRSFKRQEVTQFSYVRSQEVKYIQEYGSGFSYNINLLHRTEDAAADLIYQRVADSARISGYEMSTLGLNIGWAPGVRYYQNKTTRYVMNNDIPRFTFCYETALKDFMGSQYNYNKTTLTYAQLFYITPLGYFTVDLRAGKIWDKVPFPLLFVPDANQSYITQDNSFWLMGNMEFLNDQYVSGEIFYNMDGFLLGRVPLIRELRWKEIFRFRFLYGSLSDRNNPSLHTSSHDLFAFPTDKHGRQTSFELGDEPYMEVSVGLHNIFKFFKVEYVRRLNYLDNYKAQSWGINFGMGLYM